MTNFLYTHTSLFKRKALASTGVLLAGLTVSSQAQAVHWETWAGPNYGGNRCSSGIECAIWQAEAVYGPQPGPWDCHEGFDTRGELSQMTCNNHPNPYNPIYTLGGRAWPVCDEGETGAASGCVFRKEKDPQGCREGDPVDPKLGVLQEDITDFQVGEQNPLILKRSYWSDPYVMGIYGGNPMTSRLGRGWRTNFDTSAIFYGSDAVPGGVVISYGNGLQTYFEMRNTGQFVPQAYNRATDSRQWKWGSAETLTYADGIFTATDGSGTRHAFNRAGQLLTITYLGGYQQTLEWTGSLNTAVRDNLGRTITFDYDAQGMLKSASLPDGTVTRYEFTSTTQQNAALSGRSFSSIPNDTFVLTKVTAVGDGTEADHTLTYEYTDSRFEDALTGVVDERGKRISSWTYDSNRRVATNLTNAGAATYSFAYDEANSRTVVTNPLGKQTVYRYDKNVAGPSVLTGLDGVASTHCLADTKSLTYESNRDLNVTNLVQKTDGEGRITRYTRDLRGFVTSVTRGYGTATASTTSYTWHPSLYLVAQKVEPGLTTDYVYDLAGRLTTRTERDTTDGKTDGEVRTWTYGYNDGGLITAVDGPLAGDADTVRFTYSSAGFLQSVTDANGLTTKVTAWDRFGHPTQVTDANGAGIALTYDRAGRLTSFTRSMMTSANLSLAYDAAGHLVGMRDAKGARTVFAYDDGGRLTSITLPNGDSAAYTRNELGQVSAISYRDGTGATRFSETRRFDELGRLIETLGAKGSTGSTTYDRTGNPTQVIDAAGASTFLSYDALNRAMTLTDAVSASVKLTRDGKDEITSHTDPRNLTTAYVRNGFGEVIQETSPDAGTISFQREARGLVTKRTDAKGQVTLYTYDAGGRLLTRGGTSPSARDTIVTWDDAFGGNGKGRLAQIANGSARLQRTYDTDGHVTTEWQRVAPLSRAVSVTYGYDGNDRIVSITYPAGRTVTIDRDTLGRPRAISATPPGATATTKRLSLVGNVTYMPFGGVATLTFGNGLVGTYERDLDGRITGVNLRSGTGRSGPLVDRALTWQGDRLLAVTDRVSGNLTQDYTYTPAGRLASVSGNGQTSAWTYDGSGNRLTETVGSLTSAYQYPAVSNRLGSVAQGARTVRSLTYDAAGNVASDTSLGVAKIYTYDADNRLIGAMQGPPAASSSRYAYDAFDRLVSRQTAAGTVLYVYDTSDHIIAELDTNGVTRREYIWLDELPIAVLDKANLNDPLVSFVHGDHLGRPIRMSGQNGSLTWSAEYKPFGEVASLTGSPKFDLRFPGQWFQLETGLAWNWHRHYDATLGRYLQPDPLGLDALLSDGPSVYGYVGGNPLGFVDRRGMLFGVTPSFGIEGGKPGSASADCDPFGLPKIDPIADDSPDERRKRSPRYICQAIGCTELHGGVAYPLCPSCATKLLNGWPTPLKDRSKLEPGTDLFPK